MCARSLRTAAVPLLHVLLHVLLLRANGFRHSITQPSGHISAAMIQDDFGQGAGNTSIGSHHGTIQTVSRMSAMRAYHSIPQSANGALGTQWTDERFRHSLTQATSGSAVRARPNFTQSIHSANNAPIVVRARRNFAQPVKDTDSVAINHKHRKTILVVVSVLSLSLLFCVCAMTCHDNRIVIWLHDDWMVPYPSDGWSSGDSAMIRQETQRGGAVVERGGAWWRLSVEEHSLMPGSTSPRLSKPAQ